MQASSLREIPGFRELSMKFIFEVQVRPGTTIEDYAEVWQEASRIIQQAPGARGT